MLTRRSLLTGLTGLAGLIAAPAIVRAGSLMPIRGVPMLRVASPVVPHQIIVLGESTAMGVYGYNDEPVIGFGDYRTGADIKAWYSNFLAQIEAARTA